ncbi:hypothetical protein L208DRAFT_1472501 [Tricholoma matsutake]|nr:hypothetical protein L208DRAFT_1472501 [Tricholoma matsutake 945]
MMADCIPHSLEISLVPRTAPTPSPSYTVWCHCGPSLYHSLVFILPFLYKTTATLIFPSIPELLVNTFTSGSSCSTSAIALSMLLVTLVLTFGFHLVSKHTTLMVSMVCGLILYLCIKLCSGVGCHFTSLLVVFAMGLCRGCVAGSVASWMVTHCQCLLIRRLNGIRFAITSSMSVAVVFIAPIIMIAAHLCIDASIFTIAWFALQSFILLPTFCCGVRKMSVAYNIWGTAMERYSCHMCLAFIPWDVWDSLPNWTSQSCPFAIAAAHCDFQFSLLSTITPRNLAVSFDSMHWFLSTRAHLGIGIHFWGFSGCGASFFVISSSWNFSIPNSQLWSLAHSNMPPFWFMMFCSFSWVSKRSLPMTITTVSSTNSSIHSPLLNTGIFSRSALYIR